MVNNAFAYAFSIATVNTPRGEEIEQNKYVGHVSTIMRLLKSKDGDLLSYFDKIDESQNGIEGSPLNKILDNHEVAANRGKVE